MEPSEYSGNEEGLGTAPLPCKMSGDLASNLRVGRIYNEKGLVQLACHARCQEAWQVNIELAELAMKKALAKLIT